MYDEKEDARGRNFENIDNDRVFSYGEDIMKKVNLLCFPHAGGTAGIYHELLANEVAENIKIVPIELPGRGKRFCETLIEDFDDLIDDLWSCIKSIITKEEEYALFGYSMGSRLIFALYYKIVEHNFKPPVNMFFCASEIPEINIAYNDLNDNNIIQDLICFGGTSDEVLENEELLEIVIPIMRADLKVMNSYHYIGNKEKIKCPIIIINGKQDFETIAGIQGWSNYTDSTCEFVFYDDGHFFIYHNQHNLGLVISQKIQRDMKTRQDNKPT